MIVNRNLFLSLNRVALCALLLAGAAAYSDDIKADATGTWTWAAPGRNGGAGRTNTLTLQLENPKLTGKFAAPGRGGQVTETAISDGKQEAAGISFLVIRELNGNSITNKYTGKIEGDKIHGTIQFTRNGEDQTRDWEASRSNAGK